jgi:hypothetical protein
MLLLPAKSGHRRHIVPISGKDSATTAILLREMYPSLNYEYVYNVTGAELPEINAWLAKMEHHLGKPIYRIGSDLENIIYEQGMLPGVKSRFCTRLSKLYPMEDWIGDEGAVLYLGIRADEDRAGYIPLGKSQIEPRYPLAQAGYKLNDVLDSLKQLDLLPPDFEWTRIKQAVIARLGFNAHWLNNFTEIEQRQMFAGRTRPNCSFCFFQRVYEWVWLYDTHPDLFWKAVEIEDNVGDGDRREKAFTWRPEGGLRKLLERAEKIRTKRVTQLVNMIRARAQQTLFVFDVSDEAPDLLQVVSCGLLCGK